ncbi:MAG: LysE family translocator [Aquisalimonadaceae bacterium]
MPDPSLLVLFFTTSVLLALSPGPDNLFVMAQSAQHGRPAGFAVTLGLCTGLLVHTLAVSLGLAAVLQASTVAFTVLKYVGAAYLLYLAWEALRSADRIDAGVQAPVMPLRRLYVRGIFMNITNPKVSIFFLAFLPQFVDPARGAVVAQICLLGGLFILAAILVFGSLSVLAGSLGERLRTSARAQRVIHYLAGMIFTGLAARLILTAR